VCQVFEILYQNFAYFFCSSSFYTFCPSQYYSVFYSPFQCISKFTNVIAVCLPPPSSSMQDCSSTSGYQIPKICLTLLHCDAISYPCQELENGKCSCTCRVIKSVNLPPGFRPVLSTSVANTNAESELIRPLGQYRLSHLLFFCLIYSVCH